MMVNRKKNTWIIRLFYTSTAFAFITLFSIGGESSFALDNANGVDLGIVGTLGLYPVLPEEGDNVVIGVLVVNSGVRDARDVSVYFYEDDVYFEKITVDIRAGDSVYVEANWIADSGDSYISAIVDPNQEYTDDRRDNRSNAWVTVR